MNKLIALCYFVLSLFGCDGGGSTFVHRATIDGNDVLFSKAHVEAGVARFECLGSASGQCHYTVYPRECAAAATAVGERDACATAPVQRFAVNRGDSRQITGLRDFRLCVSAERGRQGPDCESAEPIAAR
ncbi:hypothetical protein WCE41_02615 [Luteimonas sp. MJ246]|uniref:hypothetical protein n=1 Tax=Luteimonas sp. MJ174 TaxID=3129237 RepID=UPI0031BB49D1